MESVKLSRSDYLFMVEMWLKYKRRHDIHIEWKREISEAARRNRMKKRKKYRGKPVNRPVVLKLNPKKIKQRPITEPYIPFQMAEGKESCLDIYKEYN